ncbi:MAG: M42 family metallopeptidase [Clostridiaceae bacterium]|nr:M42 family metallopeptidase [Clostridiaceae bacterium]
MTKQGKLKASREYPESLIDTLKKLTMLDGVSGDEKPVRDFIMERIKDRADSWHVDNIGNLIVFSKGTGLGKKVMLAAHMDEVGLLITGINDNGLIKFKTVGGIEPRVLVGKRVRIGKDRVPGVIGYKPVHLQDSSERKNAVKKSGLTIDIGAKDREQAEESVAVGDTAAFDYDPVEFGDHKLMAKALDNRVGCVMLAELLGGRYPFDLYGCFTVQEEIGLKGAKAASYAVEPDAAIILEGTTCYDLTGTDEHMMSTRLGDGPALTVMDRSVIPDRDLYRFITHTAKSLGIPWQVKRTISGGTDAGRIQVSGRGVKVCTISVPCRYIHTPVSVMDKRDFFNTLKLAEATLAGLAGWFTRDGNSGAHEPEPNESGGKSDV